MHILALAVLMALPGTPVQAHALGLDVKGHTAHRRPIVGESEPVRWTVTNIGDGRFDDVRLDVSVPPGWTLHDDQGCTHDGPYLHCDLGPLAGHAHRTFVFPMTARRPLGTVRLHAWTHPRVGTDSLPGPETSFPVTVVTHRG